MAIDACTGDRDRVLASVLKELQRVQGRGGVAAMATGGAAVSSAERAAQDTHALPGHDGWLAQLGQALVSQLASSSVGTVANGVAGSEGVWPALLGALVLQWQSLQRGKLQPGNPFTYRMVRFLVQLLHLSHTSTALHAQLEKQVQAIPWKDALQRLLNSPSGTDREVHAFTRLTGKLCAAVVGTPGILAAGLYRFVRCDIKHAMQVLDTLWDTVSDTQRDAMIKNLICNRWIQHTDCCGLLGRMRCRNPLGHFSVEELRQVLSAACKSGDEAFVGELVAKDKLRIVGERWSVRVLEEDLLYGARGCHGPATQRIAAALLRASESALQPDLDRAVKLIRYGARFGDHTMWLLRAYIYAPPEHAVQLTTETAQGMALPVNVCMRPRFLQQPWGSILPDLMACDAGRQHGAGILQACRQGCPQRAPLATTVYRRVQWRGRKGAGLVGRRGIVLQRMRARARASDSLACGAHKSGV